MGLAVKDRKKLNELIGKVAALDAAATHGPWKYKEDKILGYVPRIVLPAHADLPTALRDFDGSGPWTEEEIVANRIFVCEARTILPQIAMLALKLLGEGERVGREI